MGGRIHAQGPLNEIVFEYLRAFEVKQVLNFPVQLVTGINGDRLGIWLSNLENEYFLNDPETPESRAMLENEEVQGLPFML